MDWEIMGLEEFSEVDLDLDLGTGAENEEVDEEEEFSGLEKLTLDRIFARHGVWIGN